MVNNLFIILDVSLLVAFLIFLVLFLVKNKKNLAKDGVLYLYRTAWGIKLIDKIGNKYKRTLHILSYFSIFMGYILMVGILYLLGIQTFEYLTNPAMVELIKAPPIAPLIPYFPQLFGFGDLFPPFYAIYFIVSILIVATVHEFAHGIFAKRWGVKIKSTGFAFFKFFPVFFGAFVEQDDKQLTKKSKFKQLSILSAGVFSNIVMAVIFLILLGIFFSLVFAPTGVIINDYSYSLIPIASITEINNISLTNPNINDITPLIKNNSINEIKVNETNYVGIKGFSSNKSLIALYDDAPAINANLDEIILEINGKKTTNLETFREELARYSPGENITIKTNGDKIKEVEIFLGKNPRNESQPFLGVLTVASSNSNKLSERIATLFFLKNSSTYYESKIGKFGDFVYYLLWWIFFINILVGLFNMLPLGILDGGRFFYLTMLGLTKSERITKLIQNIFAYVIFGIFLLLMIRWTFSLF